MKPSHKRCSRSAPNLSANGHLAHLNQAQARLKPNARLSAQLWCSVDLLLSHLGDLSSCVAGSAFALHMVKNLLRLWDIFVIEDIL